MRMKIIHGIIFTKINIRFRKTNNIFQIIIQVLNR